jgi:hypothetical protein
MAISAGASSDVISSSSRTRVTEQSAMSSDVQYSPTQLRPNQQHRGEIDEAVRERLSSGKLCRRGPASPVASAGVTVACESVVMIRTGHVHIERRGRNWLR